MKIGISVSSMITMFSIMSSIFKTWIMLNAVQANLLVSGKVIKRESDGAILIRGHSNLDKMFRLCLNFYLDISFFFLRNKLTCTFQTLTAYLHEESDLCFFSIAYQQVHRLYIVFSWGHSGNLIFLLIHSTRIKVKLS